MTKEEKLIRKALLGVLYEILLVARDPNSEFTSLSHVLADHAHNIPLWLKQDQLNSSEIEHYYESERVYCIEKLTEMGFADELKRFEPHWEVVKSYLYSEL